VRDKYILISPVYNEEDHLDALVQAVVNQTILPQIWLFVNDGSTDATGDLIDRYSAQYEFVGQLRLSRDNSRTYYSGKTHAFLAGYQHIKDRCEYDFVANLDADVVMRTSYYEDIMREFDANPRLGVAGGKYSYNRGHRVCKVLFDELSVPGSVQMFRRECYEEIGGYLPLKYGGDDTLATITARMRGWETKAFPEYEVLQRREVGTTDTGSVLRARFRQGLTEYGVATHPFFMLVKSANRALREKPYVFGSATRLLGFLYGYLRREERRIPLEAVRFVRREQMRRLMNAIKLKPGCQV